MLPSTGELQPAGKLPAGRSAMMRARVRIRPGAPWLGALIVAAMITLLLLLQCAGPPHHMSVPAAAPHHAIAAGSALQRSQAAIAPHNHLGAPAPAMCALTDAVSAQLTAPAAVRVLWIAALIVLAYAVGTAVLPVLMRGPPHTGPVAIVTGRTLIHRLCVLRR
ncbi:MULTISPECIES: hypothetical protein [Mycobacteriaceae]|nr:MULTISPECIES: hypothetical protein [Mycobacteriaceae]MDO3014878.1 hypothetical protein [Mycobacteroides abscessus subsp. abscessus]